MTTPPSDPYETPGENHPAQPPRYGDAPSPHQGQEFPQRPGQMPPPYQGQVPPGYPAGQYGQEWPASGYPPYGQPPGKPEPPSSILTAVKLMYAGAVLSLIWALLIGRMRDDYADALADADLDVTAREIDSTATGFIGFMVVIGLITVGLWIWMARTNRNGRAWARVVATILGGIAVLGGLLGLAQNDAIGLVMNLALVMLSIWILVLLYRRESTEYYNAVSRQPRY
ncbi:MAG TPA: hypothetical protein VFR23_12300 [Jiangellaceae bacterium]|nr:hypothetical protein [Jiangellaceae bacterium]